MNMILRTACCFRMTVWQMSRKDDSLRVTSSYTIHPIANGWQTDRYMSAMQVVAPPRPGGLWGDFFSESRSWGTRTIASWSWTGRMPAPPRKR